MQTDSVYKLIEVVGTSAESIEDAIQNAIRKSSETFHQLDWFEVLSTRGSIQNGTIKQFQVIIKIGLRT